MRILLTGTSGQVGRALRPLLAADNIVLAPPRGEFDLARPSTLGTALAALQPDIIINPAAYTAVDRAEDERELAFSVNAHAVEAMAGWAAARGVPLIHFSTDYVFDGSGTAPWREDSATAPLSVYGASKLAGDAAVTASGAPHLIARTSWVYAASGANFLRTIARLAGERKELRIVADQIGAPTSARAIADAVATIVGSDAGALKARLQHDGGVVNLVCGGETSWHGFASAIVTGLRERGVTLAAETITPIAAAEFPTKAKRPGNSRLDLSRLRERFGIAPPSWQDALEAELDEFVAMSR